MTERFASRNSGIDVAIITVRQDEERAVLERMPMYRALDGQRQIYAVADVPVGSEKRRLAVVRCLEEGQSEAHDVARDVIEDLNPGAILVVGIGGGFPSAEYSLGDVVIATRIQDLRVVALFEGKEPEFDVRGGPVTGDVKRVVGALQRIDLGDWNSAASIGVEQPSISLLAKNFYGPGEWRANLKKILKERFGANGTQRRNPAFVTGPIISTDSLVKQVKTVKRWRQFVRKALACEMELAAVLHAAQTRHHAYPVYGIRGISDVIGFRRADAWTRYACGTAAAFAFALLRTGLVPSQHHARAQWLRVAPAATASLPTASPQSTTYFKPAEGFLDRGEVDSAVATILQGTSYNRAEPSAQLSVAAAYQKFGFLDEAWQCHDVLTSSRSLARLDVQKRALCSLIEFKLYSQTPDLVRVRDSYQDVLNALSQASLSEHRAAVYRRAAVAYAALGVADAARECVAHGLAIDQGAKSEHSKVTGRVFATMTLTLGANGSVTDALATLKSAPYVYLSGELNRAAFHAHPLKSAGMCLFTEAAVRFVTLGEGPTTWMCLAAAHVLGGLASAHPLAEGYAELLSLLRSRDRYWELLRSAMSSDREQRRKLHHRYPELARHLAGCQNFPELLQPATVDAWRQVRAHLDAMFAEAE